MKDCVAEDVLTHLPKRSRRNAELILEFLKAVSDLNIVISAISNTGTRKTIAIYKTDRSLSHPEKKQIIMA